MCAVLCCAPCTHFSQISHSLCIHLSPSELLLLLMLYSTDPIMFAYPGACFLHVYLLPCLPTYLSIYLPTHLFMLRPSLRCYVRFGSSHHFRLTTIWDGDDRMVHVWGALIIPFICCSLWCTSLSLSLPLSRQDQLFQSTSNLALASCCFISL